MRAAVDVAIYNNLIISGGPLHDFAATSAVLAGVFDEVGVSSTIIDDPNEAIEQLSVHPESWDMVTVNALLWAISSPRHAHLKAQWSFAGGSAAAQAIHRYVHGGGSLLACHTAVICFDAHPMWAECIGAIWDWERSMHPPLGSAAIALTPAGTAHPVSSGTAGFTTVDEVYGFLDAEPGIEPLLTSAHGGVDHPVLWARSVGDGRVVTDLLGHDSAAMAHPAHIEILRRSAQWLMGRAHSGGHSSSDAAETIGRRPTP